MTAIEITADGRRVVTTKQAAEAHGITQAAMRKAISVADLDPVADLDGRTPLYDPDVLARALSARPGRGAPGRRRRAS